MEYRNDPHGYPYKLLAESGGWCMVQAAGIVPEVVDRRIWDGWRVGSETDWKQKTNKMQNG